MRFGVLLIVCVSLATISLSNAGEFSQVRDLPAMKLGATDLDAILLKTRALIDAANGPEDSGRETVKVSIDGQEIEIPHLSLASSVAFPNEAFGFAYMYSQADKPISSVTIDLDDSLRRVSVSGGSADKVETLSKLLEKDFHRYSTAVGGVKFRRVTGICLSMLFLSSLMIGGAYCWNNRNRWALGMPICSAIGFLLVLLLHMEQISSRLCSLSALFTLFSRQARVSAFCARSAGDVWLEFRCRIFLREGDATNKKTDCATCRTDYSASQLRACSSSLGG